MKFVTRLIGCAAILILTSSFTHAAECDDPKSSELIAQCLGQDLRESDIKINASYQELMKKLNETDKTNLRLMQRAWIKDRDMACQLDNKESNRERWYQALLKDYTKTVCVTRFTRQRTLALNAMLTPKADVPAINTKPVAAIAPAAQPTTQNVPSLAFDKRPVTLHSSGKWYFEFLVNYGEVVKIEPCVLTVGVTNFQWRSGILDNVRPKHAGKENMRYGFAVDLDNGKLYISRNGAWTNGEPGSNQGHDLKLGQNYFAQFSVSADSPTDYLANQALVPNFGDSPMAYALPAGYVPWRNNTKN
jgi:uncharacterized protein YecT (DUF1311 family)